jgi:hypothetical protein
MRRIVLFAVCHLFLNFSIAQNNIDSLEKVLKLNQQDSNKVKTLCALSDALENSQPKKSIW